MLAKVGRLFLVMSGKFKLCQVKSVFVGSDEVTSGYVTLYPDNSG